VNGVKRTKEKDVPEVTISAAFTFRMNELSKGEYIERDTGNK
jgi:hypothetical protein